MFTRILTIALTALFCVAAAQHSALAEEAQGEPAYNCPRAMMQGQPMTDMPMGKGMGRRGEMAMPDMADLMQLSKEQIKSYIDALTKSQKQCLDIRSQLLLTKVNLHAALAAEKFDKAKAAEMAKKLADLKAQKMRNSLDLVIELRAMGLPYETVCRLGDCPLATPDMMRRAGKRGMMRHGMMQKRMQQGPGAK